MPPLVVGLPLGYEIRHRVCCSTARNSSSIIAYRLSGSDKKRGSCLNEGPCVASLLLKNKAEVLVAGVCAKASFFVLVEV